MSSLPPAHFASADESPSCTRTTSAPIRKTHGAPTRVFTLLSLVATLTACTDATSPTRPSEVGLSAANSAPAFGRGSSKGKRGQWYKAITWAQAQSDTAFRNAPVTTFPTTEAVFNTCRNESVVLNGVIQQREALWFDQGTQTYQMVTWKDTRGVLGEATELQDTDHDPRTPPVPVQVTYRNRQFTLDRFDVAETGLPFTSVQISAIYLQRQSSGLTKGRAAGDDMIVYASQVISTDVNGQPTEKNTYKTFCW
jgi:hypothetical protein